MTGHSGSSLFIVTPSIILNSQSNKSAVLKFGPLDEIKQESRNYDKFVEWFLTVEQTVRKISYKEENNTAAILYSYPKDRKEGFIHYASFIRKNNIDKCLTIIDKMFNVNNKHWLSVDGNEHIFHKQ